MFAKIFGIIWRVIVVIVSCYLAFSFLVYFLKPKPVDLASNDDYSSRLGRLTLRPAMDLAFEQRVSHDWDWQDFKVESYRQKESENALVKINNPTESSKIDFMSKAWWDISNPAQSIILQPEDPNLSAKWMLIRCVEKENVLYCQKNNILIKDLVKTSVYKSEQIYLGIDTQGNYIKLKNIQVINSDQRKDILYI
jgi:hypothetical protein